MTSTYRINDTSDYHRNHLNTLGWELTVCNALENEQSPCRSVLAKPTSYGNLLYEYLETVIPIGSVSRILEIGGGYGYVMRDFLKKMPSTKATMLDLSPAMLARQRETLKDFRVEFIQKDFFSAEAAFLQSFDLAILNEIVGDLPTICGIDPNSLAGKTGASDPLVSSMNRIFTAYSLPVPGGQFNFNLGALEALEKLCAAGIRYIFISEHSSEAPVPDKFNEKTGNQTEGDPEQIRLMGHDEYTVRFSHLAAVAGSFGYRVLRGQYKNFIILENSGRLNFVLSSNSMKDEHEMIRQFAGDLYKYEYLILIRD